MFAWVVSDVCNAQAHVRFAPRKRTLIMLRARRSFASQTDLQAAGWSVWSASPRPQREPSLVARSCRRPRKPFDEGHV